MQSLIEMSIGVAIGAITFSGSIIAFAKLNGNMSGAPIILPARHVLNFVIALAIVASIVYFVMAQAHLDVLGDHSALVLARRHAHHPDRRRRHAGRRSRCSTPIRDGPPRGIGFTLENTALIITGALVGSSGAILSYIMCKGMNRSFISVILGGFGGEVAAAAGTAKRAR